MEVDQLGSNINIVYRKQLTIYYYKENWYGPNTRTVYMVEVDIYGCHLFYFYDFPQKHLPILSIQTAADNDVTLVDHFYNLQTTTMMHTKL